ncbi:MAG: ABC transporter substrate-binding protein, partial [Spirochaetales bacterium]|nr:ABC transporter substrate-binding protein [Spirochaetales bacterium]
REAVAASVSAMNRTPSCYYALGFGDGGDWTSGGGTFIGELLTMAGGRNIAQDVEGWSYSKELLVAEQPRIILVNRGMKEQFLSLPVYKDLEASVKGMVFEIDENSIVRQGPRQIDALEEIHRIMETAP